MNQKLSFSLLLVITCIAFLVRFILLGAVPPSPNWDEAALGYNAFSLWETGRDEYGKFLPVVLRSFDDYKPALYAYLVIPSYLLFGLSTFAVRFPSMVFGVLTVFATYFLVIEIFGKHKLSFFGNKLSSKVLGLVTSSLLAISPWHIQFSRIAFESNVGLAFNVFGALFFVKGMRKHAYLLLSAFFFGINPSMYQSDKVFTPLLVLTLSLIYWKSLWKLPKKYLASAALIGLIVLTPMIYFHLTDEQALARAQGVSVFSDQTAYLKDSVQKLEVDRERGDVLGIVFDNRRVEYAKGILAGYLAHFDLNWLFVTGDITRHHAPNMGLLYLFELPFLLIGIYHMVFGRFSKQAKLVVFSWFFLAPVPAMITSGVPHAVRTLNFLPMFQIFTAVGLIASVLFIQKLRGKSAIVSFVGLGAYFFSSFFVVFNIVFYFNQYFVQQNVETSQEWLYGYEQAVETIRPLENEYERIVVTNRPPLDQSYMFFLFYLQHPPEDYQAEEINESGGFREGHAFGKFEFHPIGTVFEDNVLYVGRPSDFPEGVDALKTIDYLDGSPAIKIVPGNNI